MSNNVERKIENPYDAASYAMYEQRMTPFNSVTAFIQTLLGAKIRKVLGFEDPVVEEIMDAREEMGKLVDLAMKAGRFEERNEAERYVRKWMADFSPKYAHFDEAPSEKVDVSECLSYLEVNNFQKFFWLLRQDRFRFKNLQANNPGMMTDKYDCHLDLVEGEFIKKVWQLIAEEKFVDLMEMIAQVMMTDDLMMIILKREIRGVAQTLINSGKFHEVLDQSFRKAEVSIDDLKPWPLFWRSVGVIL